MSSGKHLFALYVDSFCSKINLLEKIFCLREKDLWQRVFGILRLQEGEQVVFFDDQSIYLVTLTQSSKGSVCGILNYSLAHKPLMPRVTLYQALPKKSCFEAIVHTAAVLGITTIVPVITQKSAHIFDGADQRFLTRMHALMQAGCEQAKQFSFPALSQAISFDALPLNCASKSKKILFHQTGKPLVDLIAMLSADSYPADLSIAIGPEGDFTDHELHSLREQGFEFYQLTPSVLRTEDAVMIGLGFVRSFFNKPTLE